MSFSRMIGESFLDYFHFDSKFFRTIIPLIIRPGKLTVEYMLGKRKTYVEPFRLFLVISIIYFLLLPLSKDSDYKYNLKRTSPATESAGDTLTLRPKILLDGMPVTRAGTDSMRREIDSIGLQKYVDKTFAKSNRLLKFFLKQAFKITFYSGQSFETVMEHTASKLIFLLIPVFALLLKLVYFRSKRLYYEHLIFSLHIHAFVFLVLFTVLLIQFVLPVNPLIVPGISLVYLYFALKRNYARKTGKTIGRFFLLIFFYGLIALPLFFSLLIVVSIFLV